MAQTGAAGARRSYNVVYHGAVPSVELHQDLRHAVRDLCKAFPDSYWRELDAARAYPDAFVKALTDAGYLAALIPEEYGGSGLGLAEASIILEEINRSGGNAGACHAQMYTMGTLLRHGSDAQKREYLPKIATGELRLQAFGVTEPTTGSDTTQLKTTATRSGDRYVVSGQKVWISRAEHSDLLLLVARTTPIEQVKKRTEGLSILLVDLREAVGHGLTIRPIRTMMNHATTELFFDDLEVPADNLIGEEGQGLPLPPRRPERRAHPDRRRVHRRRPLVHRARHALRQGARRLRPADRPEPGRAVSDRPRARQRRGGRPDALQGGGAVRPRRAVRQRGEHGEAAGGRRVVGGGQRRRADARRLRLRRRYDVERKFRETRLYQVAPISTNLILAYVAEHVLGLPRSY